MFNMITLKGRFFFSLIAVLINRSNSENKNPLLETIQFFREYHSSSCNILVYTTENLRSKTKEIHDIIYQITKELNHSNIAAMSFDQLLNTYASFKCNTPMFIVTQSDNGTKNEMKKISYTSLFHNTQWLLFLQSPINEFFVDIRTPFNLGLVVAIRKSEDYVEFLEVYRVLESRPLRTPHLGNWTTENGFIINSKNLHERRYDLEGIIFKTGSTNNYPMNYFTHQPSGKTTLNGYFPDIWKELEELLNFTSVNYRSIDNVTGIPEISGKWNGLIGMLEREEIHVGLSYFIMDQQRFHAVDFTRPILRTSYQIFFKNVGDNFNYDAVLRPFKKEIWFTVVGWIIYSSFFSTICHKWTHKHRIEKKTKKEDFNIINSGFFFIKSLCNQGHDSSPTAISSRIIFLSAYVVAGVLVPSYSAALVFFITSKSPKRPFDSLQELLQIGNYKLQTVSKTADYTYFSNSTNPLLYRIYDKLMRKIPEDQMPFSIPEAIAKLCSVPNLAHFGDSVSNFFTINKMNAREENCKIMHLSKEISSAYSCIALNRNSPFKPVIDHFLLKMSDRGILSKIRRKVFVDQKKFVHQRFWTTVESNDVLQIFIILLTGIILSVLIFIIEITLAKSRELKKNKIQKHTPLFHLKKIYH